MVIQTGVGAAMTAPGGQKGYPTTIPSLLIGGAAILFVAQLMLGTSVTFAGGVFLSLIVVILTLRMIGWSSIAGILIAYSSFRYIAFSQVIKTLYGQAGDTHLGSPETTIAVILIGTCSICFAAIVIAQFLGTRKILDVEPSVEVLKHIRNSSFAIGAVLFLIGRYAGVTEGSDIQYGGIDQAAHQLGQIFYLPILAETWRVLIVTRGRQSTSFLLYCLVIGFAIYGFLANSKEGTAAPVLFYFIASAAYRRRVTREQVTVCVCTLLAGIFFAYPAIHLLRSQKTIESGVPIGVSLEFIYDSIVNPSSFVESWSEQEREPPTDIYGNALNYLGDFDDLEARFMLIANTDVIVTAVNESGVYGLGLATMGLGQLLPTFIYPDKPRDFTGDLLTWSYGLRGWGVTGAPTIGLYADCYAAGEWAGIVLLPLIVMLVFFFEIGICGRYVAGNFIGSFCLYLFFHAFSEGNLATFENITLRVIPSYFVLIYLLFRFADVMTLRRNKQEALSGGSNDGLEDYNAE